MMLWHARLPPLVRQTFMCMGTLVTISIAPGQRQRRAEAEAAIGEVRRILAEFSHDWWAWGRGALGLFNRRLAEGRAAPVSSSMRPLFTRAWEMRQATGGLFEPRIAALVRLWGFDDVARTRSAPPSPEEVSTAVAALRRAPPYSGNGAYGPAPGVGWDFGGIAKGYIADVALSVLRERGFPDATLDAGGNLAVRGTRGHRAWRIGIRNPRGGGSSLLVTLEATDEAVNTHGDDQRYFEHNGRRYAHLLDPATGTPSQGLRSLTVVHADGTLAEAGGAALYVAGTDRWPQLARKLGITQVMAVTDDGSVWATPQLAARLKPEAGVEVRVA